MKPGRRFANTLAARARGMLGLALIAAVTTPFAVGGCAKVYWRPDLGGAMRLAAQHNEPVLVQFWSPLNDDCLRMEREVFALKDVQASMQGMIPVRLDAVWNRSLMQRYDLSAPPAFIIFGPDGSVLRQAQGFMEEGRFRGFVEAAKLSL